MTFGEKLYKLRKEKKLSQEALGEMLNTTRQAVSKWENDQGYPEAEKILALSEILGVSTDYLLKEDSSSEGVSDEGYYVSREKAESWLNYERVSTRRIGAGIVFLLLIRIPAFILPANSTAFWISSMALAAIGIGIILFACLSAKDYEYKQLKRNALIFDSQTIAALKERYGFLKKKYILMIIIAFGVILFGATGLAIFDESTSIYTIYSMGYTAITILSIFALIYSISMMNAYELLVENEKHTNGMLYKLLYGKRRK